MKIIIQQTYKFSHDKMKIQRNIESLTNQCQFCEGTKLDLFSEEGGQCCWCHATGATHELWKLINSIEIISTEPPE